MKVRYLFGGLLLAGLALLWASFLVTGLYTGRFVIRFGHVITLKSSPLGFWAIIVMFAVAAAGFSSIAYILVRKTLAK